LLPHVRAPAWLIETTSPEKLEPVRTIVPKSRFWTHEIVKGLNIFAVAVACVAGLTAAAGVLLNASAIEAQAIASNFFILGPTVPNHRAPSGAGFGVRLINQNRLRLRSGLWLMRR
jgi:hypothetical protein